MSTLLVAAPIRGGAFKCPLRNVRASKEYPDSSGFSNPRVLNQLNGNASRANNSAIVVKLGMGICAAEKLFLCDRRQRATTGRRRRYWNAKRTTWR